MEALPLEARLALTLLVGAACGLLFKPTKLPAALMVGAMGADVSTVAILQLVRQTLGTAVMPAMVAAFDRAQEARGRRDARAATAVLNESGRAVSLQRSIAATLAVFCAATAAGLVGRATGVPGMTFALAIVAALVLKVRFDFAYVPRWMRQACRVGAGCYIGTFFSAGMLASLAGLVLPALIVAALYAANCFVTGGILRRLFGYGRKESMLMASPAAASDMALVLDDLGVRNADVVVVQAVRAIVVVAAFPQVVNVVCHLFFPG